MADTPVFGNPAGLTGRVNVGGGGTNELRKIEGTLQPNLGVSTVTITGVPFKPKYYSLTANNAVPSRKNGGFAAYDTRRARIRATTETTISMQILRKAMSS